MDDAFLNHIQPHQRGESLYRNFLGASPGVFANPVFAAFAPYIHYTDTNTRDLRVASDHFQAAGMNCMTLCWRPRLEKYAVGTKVEWATIQQLAQAFQVNVERLAQSDVLSVHFNFDVKAPNALMFLLRVTHLSISAYENT